MTQGTRGTARLPNQVLEPQSAEAGLTLIELLVVVFLLGLLAQAAVLASAGALEEAQQQTTQQTLGQLEIALLGQPQRLDSLGRPNFSGFVADVGGLPMHRGSPASATPEEAAAVALRELWMQPGEAPPGPGQPPVLDADGLRYLPGFALQASSLDPDVRLACGWRGPYLRLGVGVAALRDGWGRPCSLFDRQGVPSVVGSEIASILSYGADAQPGGAGYSSDLQLHLDAAASVVSPTAVPSRYQASVALDVTMSGTPGGFLVVRLFGPEDGRLVVLDQIPAPGALPIPFQFPSSQTTAVERLVFDRVSIGPRLVRAYRATSVPGSVTDEVLLPDGIPSSSGSLLRNVSPVLPITVEPFAIQPLQLTIQGS